MAKQGRPPGLLLNHAAVRHLLDGRSQSWLSKQSGISTAHLSEMMSGTKAATVDVAERLSTALGVEPAVVFPELVEFRTQVRHFTAPGAVAA